MEFPDELLYSKEHVWIRVEGGKAVLGLTDFAIQELGEVAAVELPEEGDVLEQDDNMGSLEAHKSVSELYTPVSGKVRAVNEEVMDNPGLINDDPYDGGWLLEVTLEDDSELKSMMNSDEYSEYIYEAEL